MIELDGALVICFTVFNRRLFTGSNLRNKYLKPSLMYIYINFTPKVMQFFISSFWGLYIVKLFSSGTFFISLFSFGTSVSQSDQIFRNLLGLSKDF